MLDVAKAFIEWSGVGLSQKPTHGIADPRVNSSAPTDLSHQTVVWDGLNYNHDLIFPELLKLLSHGRVLGMSAGVPVPVLELMANVPAIHRTYRTVEGGQATFLPIDQIEPVYSEGEVWLSVKLPRYDRAVEDGISALRSDARWGGFFREVQRSVDEEVAFESDATFPAVRRWVERGLAKLGEACRSQVPLGAFVGASGYSYFAHTDPRAFPPTAAIYATMFYFGSVTRYRPDHFAKLVSGRHGWLISEFIAAGPQQFAYSIASEMAGVEVIPAVALAD